MSTKARMAIGFLALFFVSFTSASKLNAATPQGRDPWFLPATEVADDPLCATLLEDARAKFLTDVPWVTWRTGAGDGFSTLERVVLDTLPTDTAYEVDPTTGDRTGRSTQVPYLMNGSEKVFVWVVTNPGCGGACESYQMAVSVGSAPYLLYRRRSDDGDGVNMTPASVSWSLYKAPNDAHYILGLKAKQLQAYRITTVKPLALSCAISVEPTTLRESEDRAVQLAFTSIGALSDTLGGMSRGSGYCGSSNALGRFGEELRSALDQTLYRPWAVVNRDFRASDNSYGDYERIIQQLETWSLGGVLESQAFAAYKQQLAATTRDLAQFYTVKFGWTAATAESMATQALTTAVSRGFGFYLYTPFGEAEQLLRRAILEHRSLDEIAALSSSYPWMERSAQESLLSVAVTYPEALQYLIGKGADPGEANAFGKTPLMYAAQYNQYQSAKLLLEAGADPNAGTIWPDGQCEYSLQTSNMTALHYAVRYGSAELVRLLLGAGSVTFAKTERQAFDGTGEYPIDWLLRYTATDSSERNPNIQADEVSELASALAVPSDKERTELAARLVSLAESHYAAGREGPAYSTLLASLMADSGNERALSDMSLVALKVGRRGVALKTAMEVVTAKRSPKSVAAAWFNVGLACQQNLYSEYRYDGQIYCNHSAIYPYLKSWKSEPTAARKNKVEEVLVGGWVNTCRVQAAAGPSQLFHFTYSHDDDDAGTSPKQFIYVYHLPSQVVDPSTIKLEVEALVALTAITGEKIDSPRLVERLDFGTFSITVLRADFNIIGGITVNGRAVPVRRQLCGADQGSRGPPN